MNVVRSCGEDPWHRSSVSHTGGIRSAKAVGWATSCGRAVSVRWDRRISMNTTVRDVMTTKVVTVPQAAGYKDIVTVLREHRVNAVPVLDDDRKVVGVVSEADRRSRQAR
jgi:CBS-domain-containing membrane protein